MNDEKGIKKGLQRLFTAVEAAEYIGVLDTTIRCMRCRGRIEGVKDGDTLYFTREILDDYIERRGTGRPSVIKVQEEEEVPQVDDITKVKGLLELAGIPYVVKGDHVVTTDRTFRFNALGEIIAVTDRKTGAKATPERSIA